MYGPPSDCKGKVIGRREVCVNVSGLFMENKISWHMMRYAACLSFETPRPRGPFWQTGFRDAVMTVLSSSLDRADLGERAGNRLCLAGLGSSFGGHAPIVLASREHSPCDASQLVGHGDDQHVARGSALK